MKKLFIVPVLLLTLFGVQARAQEDIRNKEFDILKNLEIFSEVYKNVEMAYVDEVNPGDMIKTALDAMLRTLDPYTVYIPEAQIEDFRIMTEGEYGGIGSTIHQKDGSVYISEPYEGFPAQLAGLKPGDKVIAINGESTQGKGVSDVSALMKGQSGTTLTLTVERPVYSGGNAGANAGVEKTKTFDVKLTRREIRIKNVTYSGMLDDETGYIRQDGFTQGAADEVKAAFLALKAKGMKYLVLDLRYNGGGLLNESVDIVNLFCRRGLPVVHTRGKMDNRDRGYYTQNEPLDTEIPIVFLTSRGTASASEILTGAMQDYDRAVLVGERTFGKGLVQNILPLPYNAQMKVTVAKYYIPSGRCVQALDYSNKDAEGHAQKMPDSLRTLFHTIGGREVYDGDGIEPDVEMEPEEVSDVAYSLNTKYFIFDFANRYAARHETIGSVRDFAVDDALYADFTAYMKDKDYGYELPVERALKAFRRVAEEDSCFEPLRASYEALEAVLRAGKENDLQAHRAEIARYIREEIACRYYYQAGRAEAELQDDPMVREAVAILKDGERYRAYLK